MTTGAHLRKIRTKGISRLSAQPIFPYEGDAAEDVAIEQAPRTQYLLARAAPLPTVTQPEDRDIGSFPSRGVRPLYDDSATNPSGR